ncbi:Uncharacterised protein [Mycobacteroides abscessus subsp. massiliense]|nr:Uncharacterised protein [Mycobacteroides abscessus subsp. massiliense]
MVGHRGQGVAVELLVVLDHEVDLGLLVVDQLDLLDASDAYTGHAHVITVAQAVDIGEDRRVGRGAAGDVAAQRGVHQPRQRQRDRHEDGQRDQRTTELHRDPSFASETVVPRTTGPSSSCVAELAGLSVMTLS